LSDVAGEHDGFAVDAVNVDAGDRCEEGYGEEFCCECDADKECGVGGLEDVPEEGDVEDVVAGLTDELADPEEGEAAVAEEAAEAGFRFELGQWEWLREVLFCAVGCVDLEFTLQSRFGLRFPGCLRLYLRF
jgi:hypothetical protein